MKRFRVIFEEKGGKGRQYMTLLARDKTEAELLALESQNRRAGRHDLTYARMEQNLKGKQLEQEIERRKRDFGRELHLVKVEEQK